MLKNMALQKGNKWLNFGVKKAASQTLFLLFFDAKFLHFLYKHFVYVFAFTYAFPVCCKFSDSNVIDMIE